MSSKLAIGRCFGLGPREKPRFPKLLLFGFFAIAAFAYGEDDSSARREARSLFDASQTHLESLENYDVTIRFEQSVLVENCLVPRGAIIWRIRFDRASGFCLCARLDRVIAPEDGVAGAFDHFKIGASVHVVEGNESKLHMIGTGVSTNVRESFEEALEEMSRPMLKFIGTGEFAESAMDPQGQKTRLDRVIGSTEELSVSNVADQSKVVINATFVDSRAIENHRWEYDTNAFFADRYTVKQTPKSSGKPVTLLSQKFSWKEQANLGWVPVTGESTKVIRLKVQTNDGTDAFAMAEALADVSLDWKALNEVASKDEVLKQIYSLDDVMALVGEDEDEGVVDLL